MDPDQPPTHASGFAQPLDALLLQRARTGERLAQGQIYRLYAQAVYTLLRRMVDCEAAAADLLQDSFLDAFARLKQYRGESAFGYWLRSVAASRALMHLRAQRRLAEIFSPLAEHHDLPVVDVAQLDIDWALSQLPAMPRAVLWLYHVEGYTHAEIASMRGMSESFSKSQLARAHASLRALMQAPGKQHHPATSQWELAP